MGVALPVLIPSFLQMYLGAGEDGFKEEEGVLGSNVCVCVFK